MGLFYVHQGRSKKKKLPETESLKNARLEHRKFLFSKGIDPDKKIFKKGDFVTFEPGSTHSSHTKEGCLILVFMRGINKPL